MERTPNLITLAATLCLLSTAVLAAPAGTVLFTQTGSQIVGADGTARPAQRGDVLQHGEKLLTPAGGISQILMQDGSILGVRPETELRFDPPIGSALPAVSLLQGSVRVIAAELMDAKRPSAMTLRSGEATLRLKGGDVETTVVDDKQRRAVEPGSYSRLITGNASIGKGSLVEPLSPRQVSFVGSANLAPVVISSASPELFGNKLTIPVTGGSVDTSKTTALNTPSTGLQPPVLGTTRLAAPVTSPILNTSTMGTLPTKTTVVLAPLPPPPKVAPIVIVNPVPVQPPKLPVVSCKILKTC
jgi:hypothetical protein